MVVFKRKFSISSSAVPVPWELIDNYSKESTIHGVKYLGEKKQHWIERVFWISIFIVSISFCITNMVELYHKRQEKPVMISVSKQLTPTFDIPFPAVTICPEMKAKCDKVNVTNFMIYPNFMLSSIEEMKNRFKALSHICDSHVNDETVQTISNSSNSEYDVIKILEEIGFTQDDFFEKCRYGSWKFKNCSKYFVKILTDVGICYTFNMLNYKDYVDISTLHSDLHHPKHENKSSWFLGKDYDSKKIDVYPRRIIGSGMNLGLSVKFRFNSSMLCPSCLSGVNGFRVSLHMPVDAPQIANNFYNVPFGQETNLIVKPDMIYSSKDIRNYLPEKRYCYFSHERKLKFFKIYTKENCDLECKAEYVKNECGCVKFSMPRSNETAVCNNSQLECVHEAEMNYTIQELKKKLMEKQMKRDKKHGKVTKNDPRIDEIAKIVSCNCMPSCTSIKYDVEISQTDYMNFNKSFHYASLNIYFKDPYFSRLKRYEIYGWADYLSSSGGTLGLFLGCSVLSFIEILYHLVLYCIKKCKKQAINSAKDIPN